MQLVERVGNDGREVAGMRGHVHKRGTTWTVVYDEGRDENGRRQQRSKGGFAPGGRRRVPDRRPLAAR